VLTCEDALDLYIYMNETAEVARFAQLQRANAAAAAGSQPLLMTASEYNTKKIVFDKAAHIFAGAIGEEGSGDGEGAIVRLSSTLITLTKPRGWPEVIVACSSVGRGEGCTVRKIDRRL
jgi:hypothetical protein